MTKKWLFWDLYTLSFSSQDQGGFIDKKILDTHMHMNVFMNACVREMHVVFFSYRSPLTSVIFGINALFTKPAQALAPIVILSKLKQYGYGNPNAR